MEYFFSNFPEVEAYSDIANTSFDFLSNISLETYCGNSKISFLTINSAFILSWVDP